MTWTKPRAPTSTQLSHLLKLKIQGFVKKYSSQQNLIVKKDSMFVPTPTEGPFAKTNGKSLAQLTSCDLRSKNDQALGKQGDVSGGQGAALHCPLEGSGGGGAEAAAAGRRPRTRVLLRGAERETPAGGERGGGGPREGRAALPRPRPGPAAACHPATGRRGVNPLGSLLGTVFL